MILLILKGPTITIQTLPTIDIQDIIQVTTIITDTRTIYDALDAPTLANKYSLGSTTPFLIYDTCNTVKTGTNVNDLTISNEQYNLCLNKTT